VKSKVGTIDDIPATESFDSILYIDVLEHIKRDKEELGRAAQHLADGGRIIVLSPAFQSLFSPFDAALGHERRYTARTLAAVFPRGLKQEKLFYADSVGAMLSFSNRLLLKKSDADRNSDSLLGQGDHSRITSRGSSCSSVVWPVCYRRVSEVSSVT
jgi:hypothetical protein